MEKIRLFFTALMVLFTTGIAFAQKGEVTGVVTDAGTGEPVPFAALRVKGTTVGASADANGSYTIKVADLSSAVLVVSSVNYKDLEVAVSGRTVIDIALSIDATALDDVIVVAYGNTKRESFTGSVASIKTEGLADAPVTSVDKMLNGKLAGVSISGASGQPGAGSEIRIRGNGSINASNSPLWVVDGIPVLDGDISLFTNRSSSLTTINPNDIESITVLKDAAAAAAYGSRGANGVILVTTKSGREGESSFSASAKVGVNWLKNDSGFRVMNAHELLGYQRDAILNAGMDPDDPTSDYYRPLSLLNKKLYNDVNEFTRLGKLQEYEITARGGNAKAKYYSSFTYHKNEGIFYGVFYDKIQGRINASYKLLDNLETGVRLNLAYTNQADVPLDGLNYNNPIFSGMSTLPWEEIKPGGEWVADRNVNQGESVLAAAKWDRKKDNNYRFSGVFNLKWSPLKNLDIETKESLESVFRYGEYYSHPLAHADNGYAHQLEVFQGQIHQLTTSNTVNYNNTFGGYHNFHAVVGQEAMTYKSFLYDNYAPKVDFYIPYFTTADQTTTTISYSQSEESMLSFFGIADYNYDGKYYVQGTIRSDGSSLFGEDNRWGTFWSLSASWNIAKENWFKSVSFVDLLKLRASYGVNGNNGIAPYRAYGLYTTAIYNGFTSYVPQQIENRRLSWEKNKTWNLGVDFGLFNNKLTGSVDVYSRKTVDLLLTKRVPRTSGFSSVFTNVGSMRNNGVEVQLEGVVLSKKDIHWTVGGNIAFNRTKILDLGDDEYLNVSNGTSSYSGLRHVKGKSMYTWYLYDYYGVNPSNGEALWVTKDGSLTSDRNKARRVDYGSPEPKAVGGFNTNFSWKNFTVGASFEFKVGQTIILPNENYYMNGDGYDLTKNQFASQLNYWKKPGDTGVNPKPVASNSSMSNTAWSSRYLEDASFLRFKDFTVAYNLPRNICENIYVKGVRFYLSGLNLYCFNDVNFWDPEQGVLGLSIGTYPITKSIVGGIEITF